MALTPPHGGVAFGVPYGGTPAGSRGRGRWRLRDLAVAERSRQTGTVAARGALLLARPTLLFSPSGAHYEERLVVPLVGQVGSFLN